MPTHFHDILMITHNRPGFTRMALGALLESCDDTMRVWIWHNGDHAETLEVVQSFRDHPHVHRIHVSPENKKLREPTNWFWGNSDGSYLSKVDDDCLLPPDWAKTLRQAHEDEPRLGIIACWRFYDEDFVPELAEKKMKTIAGGHRLMSHHHVQGSGYVMKREVQDYLGPLGDQEGFTTYCQRAAVAGWDVGWYYPFVHEEHMDDARSEYYPYRTDAEFMEKRPLTAINMGVRSLEEWRARSVWQARALLKDRAPAKSFFGWRRLLRRTRVRAFKFLGKVEPWRTS